MKNTAFVLIIIFFMAQTAFAAKLTTSKEVVDLSLIDQTGNPCENFFQYACGNWLKSTPIPGDKSALYRFSEIDENTLVILKNILQNYQTGNNSPVQAESDKLGKFYSACLNTSGNEVTAKKGVDDLLEKIHLLQSKKNFMLLLASLHRQGINPFFGIYSMQNPGDATRMIATIDQGGLGLPEKGYYTDQENSKIRAEYKKHIKQSLLITGIRTEDAVILTNKIFKLENAIAKISLSAQDQQDPIKTYNPIGKMALQKISPAMDWNQYFKSINFTTSDVLNVVGPDYFLKLASLINRTSLSDLKAYMVWDAIRETSRFSTIALQNEHFNFYGKIMNGTTEREPHWKQCIASVDNSMGEALGESFIKVAFGQNSKDMADTLVFNVKDSLKEMITKLDWMDDQTKVGALKKIGKLNQKIGFPDHFRSYENLEVTDDSWFMNTLASNVMQFDETIKKANLPVNRTIWGMTPPTDNAYYDPTMNEIVFPAGILQAPLFNANSSLAANYGSTGATIGHEMTHGFDDSGSQYDELGNLKNWWSKESADVYKKKAQCLIDQYSSYKTDEGIALDGKLSLGENIADLGGLKLALAAFYKTNLNIPEDDMKTFFIAYGQSWCGKMTKEAERTVINTDVHSLPKFRVNGVISNLPEFAKAFQCSEGQAMAPKNRCSIW
ncbi:MAG: M13 family metallopeptidase [Bacteriovorax sp.]|nr:M13 family metallopeptidase [Bacteriovorax sp.]